MKLAVIGGRLQGTEACYLAHKAGIETLLIDRAANRPAQGLCDSFLQADVLEPNSALIAALQGAELVLPALENATALEAIRELTLKYGLNTAFDHPAYAISSSKLISDRLFYENQIPAPGYYPEGEPPYIVKPSGESGSAGVRRFDTREGARAYIGRLPDGARYVAQEYVEGPSYSIEVIGVPGCYKTYQVTQIHTDEKYDCNRVTCPCALDEGALFQMRDIALRTAELVSLHGIMDVETIYSRGVMKTLEIDARLPSQTPTAVYHSTCVNLIAELMRVFTGADIIVPKPEAERFVSYEHIQCERGKWTFPGEHAMADRPPLRVYYNLFGADEIITDWKRGEATLTGTFINTAATLSELENKRAAMLSALTGAFGAATI